MAWRFLDSVRLELSRGEANAVHEALTFFATDGVPPDDEAYAAVWAVIARMKAQVEHKPKSPDLSSLHPTIAAAIGPHFHKSND